MNGQAPTVSVRQFEIRRSDQRTDVVPFPRLRTLIRNGTVTATTSVREAGGETWSLAGDLDDLRGDLDAAATSRDGRQAAAEDHISRPRLIAYMALAGLVAGGMMMILAPICLFMGVLAKFVLSCAAFGGALGLGVINAAKVEDSRVIHLSAAGFAAGGLVAWFLRSPNAEFTPLHLAIIGVIGGAAFSYAIHLPVPRAVVVTAAAAILFPISIVAVRYVTPKSLTLPTWLAYLLLPLLFFLPVVPFAAFGGIIGSLIDWGEAKS